MNAIRTRNVHSAPAPRPVATVIPPPCRELRSRDFGVGYGASSGYVQRRYARSSMTPRFRMG